MRKSTSDSERKLRKVRTEVAGRSPRRVFAAYAGVVALLLMGVVPAASAAEDPGSSEGDPPSSGTSSGDAGGLLAGLSSDPQLSVASTSAPDQPQSGASAPAAQAAVTPQPLVAPAPQSEQKSVEPATDQAESGGTQVDPPGGTDPPEDASQQSNDDEQIDDEPQSGGLTEAPASQRLAIAPLTTGPPLSCAVGAVYGISAGGQLQYVTSSGVTNIGTAAGATEFNGLGIAAGGTIAYGYERTSNNETIALYTFAPSTGTWTSTGATYASGAQGNPTTGFIGGAVDLATGTYYAGGYDGTRFNIFRYNAGSNTISFVGFITGDAASASNGDMAFDAAGNLFIVRGYGGQVAVYSVTRANLLAATGSTTVALDTASSRSFGAMNNVNGVAFGSDGKAFLGNADTVRGYDMPTWTNGTNLSTSVSSTDLASCTSPPTVTIQKNIVARDTPSDQFKLTLSQGQTVAGEATTAGDQVGVQTEIVGPIPVSWGSQLTFSETLVSGNIGDKYTSTWACTGGVTSSGSGTSGTLTVPSSGSAGTVCTFTNTPKTPSWSLVKSSSPASGSVVVPGQVITYSVVATNTSLVTLPAQTVTDNLSNVLNNADFVAGSINLPSEASLSGNTLTWNVPSLAAGATKTLTYQVKVKDTATNVTLKNAVTTTGGTPLDPCPQNNPKCRETEHKTPSWSLVKSADPVSGSTVVPGQEITYTLTVNNTSSVGLPAQKVVDNLSDVLNNATFVAGSINPAAQASLDGTTLRWNVPAVAAGGSASVSYKVTVNADAKGVTLRNVATNDGGIPLDPCPQGQPNCRQTEHSTPDWSLEKLSNPASGSAVTPGSTITYTLRVTNDTGTAVTGVTVSDNLSSVVDNAALDVAGLPAGVTYDATSKTLTWTVGTLAANSVQSVDYKVTVNADAYGVTLKNVATGDGAVPPSTCASGSEECSTTHNTDLAWTLAKTSDPASGSKVSPGDTITYTLKVTSLSKDKAVTGVTVTDNLLSVVAYADLDEDGLPAGVTYDSATKTLTWAVGSLAAGQTKSIDYQVTVNADAYGVTLKNLATGSGSVPPQTCPTGSQSCSTTHDTDPA
ncbi:DUF11 domain-containing protein [Schaalia sp. JY-X159]|uniref:DUF7927 domain-containing protein n=1 Tax=Schaalia sp. JY-X159 TaxID=2758575 RepID=UPI00165E5E13|nr:DUF11 domain-containing protein [Schaalia sp. JY-X159]